MFTVKFQEIKDKSNIIPRRAYFLNQFFHGYDWKLEKHPLNFLTVPP